ncbi:DUF2892 domain-containing protein [Natronohydrobacter thiooxidans]|uniref:DUF2892 domain-containing protein n=1 Tax=Natronohydrobacter thiooxidans TaxID=87172 RepID=UPI0008FF0F5C|nr:DUF2892 domain-containing protein [Natronohydrobacter thiooxidans]
MFPSSSHRVPSHTAAEINRRIERELDDRIDHYAAHPEKIPSRLKELDDEWDIERMLEANASSLMLVGLTLGTTRDRRWLALPAGVAAFLLQHALQGWCPPLPILRRLGFRTMREIDRERAALRLLRGDLGEVPPEGRSEAARAFVRGDK